MTIFESEKTAGASVPAFAFTAHVNFPQRSRIKKAGPSFEIPGLNTLHYYYTNLKTDNSGITPPLIRKKNNINSGPAGSAAFRHILIRRIRTFKGIQETFHKKIFDLSNLCPPIDLYSNVTYSKQIIMLKNYFNIAVRSLLKHKFYSFLNILGLSIGLTCFMLITLFIRHELTYDTFHEDSDNIYRVNFRATLNGDDHKSAQSGAPMAAALLNDIPEVKETTRINDTGNWFVKRKNTVNSFKEESTLMADSNFFSFFTVPLIRGQAETALNRPNTLALDETTARKIFGNDNPIGETLVLDNKFDYEVTAVYQDLPANSHFRHNILLSMSSFDWVQNNQNWLSTNFNTYLKLQEGASIESVESKLPAMINTYIAPLIEQFLGMNMQEFAAEGNEVGFSFFPLQDIHLYSHMDDELQSGGDIKYIYIFSAVALFILLLACINFMNLSTARSANRAKEVGIRKVMGVYRSQLITQFLAEAIIVTLLSSVFAYLITFIALPYFNELAAVDLAYRQLLESGYLLFIGAIVLMVGLLAGSYPAFYLSLFKPVQVLKGSIKTGMKSGPIRSTLVVFQFSISIIMIIGTAVVFDQLSFIQNKKLGYEKEQILMVNDTWILRDKLKSFKTEASANTNILQTTISSFTPTGGNLNGDLYFKNPSAAADGGLVVREATVDDNFMSTLGLELAEGRFFSKEFPSDSTAIVINETAVRKFGLDNPVGSKLYTYEGSNDQPEVAPYRIVGVVKDFHFQSLKNDISPLIFHYGESNGFALFKIQMANADETIAHLENTWTKFVNGQPFEYQFMNEKFNELYRQEQRIGEIFTVFAALAILIACLGLFGLAAFTAEQKTKEIGIRKTLGASIPNIVNMLSKNFIKLVIISFAISVPIAYLGMNFWLEDFAYRTSLRPTTFIISGLLAIGIAWLTIGLQSWKAARNNPATSLRSE